MMQRATGIHIRQVMPGTEAYSQVYELREEILRRPLGLSLAHEDLAGEVQEIALAAFSGQTVIGCLMLQKKEGGVLKLRQMAVAASRQGAGVGKLLVRAAEEWAKENGYNSILLHARKPATGFYQRLGYQVKGEEFTEVGIPHLLMVKEAL